MEAAQGATPASPEVVPDAIGTFTAGRGLGPLVDVRRGVSCTAAMVKGWGIAVVSGVLVWVVASIGEQTDVFSPARSLLHGASYFFALMCLWGIGSGLRGLIAGSQAWYLYEGGIVHSRGKTLKAVTWHDVQALKSVRGKGRDADAGKVLAYRVQLVDGTTLALPLLLKNGRDSFVDRVVHHVRRLERPID